MTMNKFIAADTMRNAATGPPQVLEMLAIAIPSERGAGIKLRMSVKVKNIGDGLQKQTC